MVATFLPRYQGAALLLSTRTAEVHAETTGMLLLEHCDSWRRFVGIRPQVVPFGN
jgi:hypothetical protein